MDKHCPTVNLPKPKRGGGQPTLYREEYCEQIEKHMGLGFSASSFGGVVGVSVETISEWKRVHPEFSDAIKRGTSARILEWEKRLALCDGKTAAPVLFALKNIHPEEWREVQRTELTGKNGGPVEIDNMSDAELLAIAARGKRN